MPLYETIYEHRRVIAEDLGLSPGLESWAMGLYGRVIASPGLYCAATRLARLAPALPSIGPLAEWRCERDLPDMPGQRFRDWFKKKRESCRQNDQAGEDGQKIAIKESQEGDSA